MCTAPGEDPDGTTDPDIRLALGTLFGRRFASEADPTLLAALSAAPREFGEFLVAGWRVWQATEDRRGDVVAAVSVAEVDVARFGTLDHSEATTPSSVVKPTGVGALNQPPSSSRASPLSVFDPVVDPPVRQGPREEYTRDEVRAYLVKLMVEKTGYPPDTFDELLDFEADLGIDSIKQVEAMSEVRQHFQLDIDESFRMRDYPTIDAATDYIVARLRGEPVQPPEGSAQPTDTGNGSIPG